MKTTFSDIIIEVLEREDGFVDHPSDRGGATNFGITIKTLRRHGIDVDGDGDIDTEDVKSLGLELVKKLYKDQYWKPGKSSKLPPHLRELYFDMCINHGLRNAVYMLQKAARSAGRQITVDGVIGPQTLKAAEKVSTINLVRERARFYVRICKKDPSQLDFLEGWVNRCFEFLN